MTDAPTEHGVRCDVGVVGLGNMGLPVALALLEKGFRVAGNRRHEPPQAFLDAGGRGYTKPAHLADDCPIVITVMPSADALMSMATGDDGLTSTGRRDGIWIEMSTVAPAVKQRLADTLAEKGWTTIDCPISGAPEQLRSGQAVLLSSGPRETHDRVEAVLRAISPSVSYFGELGAGMHAKYTAYLLLAGHSLVAAEALAFADAAGLDLHDVLAALNGTIVSSAVFDHRAQQIFDPPDTPATGSLAPLTDTLTQLHQFAQQRRIPTPVLDQITGHLERSHADATDELVVAFYRELVASTTDKSSPRKEEQQP